MLKDKIQKNKNLKNKKPKIKNIIAMNNVL
jgi:hypothetical protein